jgi:ribonuclease HII
MTKEKYIVGVDESGCGALAGPLVVCAAAFAADTARVTTTWRGVRGDKTIMAGDSKGIKDPLHRAALEAAIRSASPAIAVIEKTSQEIDARLLGSVFPEAILLAASRCLERLKTLDPSLTPSEVLVLIDGDVARPSLPCRVECIPDGDKLDWHIGAASIVAKATHDRRIDELHAAYPRWGFDKSRGYPTKEHKAMLVQRGPTQAHRKSFRPVRDAMPRTVGLED